LLDSLLQEVSERGWEMAGRVGTITCFLCGGSHIYPGPRFETHLMNEHGALFDIEYLVQISLHKTKNQKLPELSVDQNRHSTDRKDAATQTTQLEQQESKPLAFFHQNVSSFLLDDIKTEPNDYDIEIQDSSSIEQLNGSIESVHEEESQVKPPSLTGKVHFHPHLNVKTIPEGETKTEEGRGKKEEKLGNIEEGVQRRVVPGGGFLRKVVGKEWAPNSFSSRFTCLFCREMFRRDYKLKLHLMMKHKGEPKHLMDKAKEELIKSKLDGCVHKCGLCNNKYNSIANFTRHIKDVHNISRLQYRKEYGSSEIVSRMFTCELCKREVKHTRNIIGAHMKMVHLISWKEYQDITVALKEGAETPDLPNPELFNCTICGGSVKYKREHLAKKHQIDEEVYEELIIKKGRGEDITKELPQRELFSCLICERECLDLRRHLQVCHKLTEELYQKEFMQENKLTSNNNNKKVATSKPKATKPITAPRKDAYPTTKPKVFHQSKPDALTGKQTKLNCDREQEKQNGESLVVEPLSTDLQCYFSCKEVFKKDYQLFLHLKLRHRLEPRGELEKAYAAAHEEIALTRRSGSLFNCALCPRIFNDNGAFYGHIQNKHHTSYREYKLQYGRCETESQPFICTICSKTIKHDRNTIHTHLKNVHGINWTRYLDRIRKLRRGVCPDPLPTLHLEECKVCNVSVKYLRDHLRNAHKITEKEYQELFLDIKKSSSPYLAIKQEDSIQSDTDDYEPEEKKIRRFHTSDGFEIEIEGSPYLEEVPASVLDLRNVSTPGSNLLLSKWNQCKYKCGVCETKSMSKKSIMGHIMTSHKLNSRAYKLGGYSDLEIKAEWFLCRLCGLSLKFTKDTVAAHVKGYHKLDLAFYEVTYMQAKDWPSHPDHIRKPGAMKKPGMTARKAAREREAEEDLASQLTGPATLNKCEFHCKLCDSIFVGRRTFRLHVQSLHGLEYKEYVAAHGNPQLNIPQYIIDEQYSIGSDLKAPAKRKRKRFPPCKKSSLAKAPKLPTSVAEQDLGDSKEEALNQHVKGPGSRQGPRSEKSIRPCNVCHRLFSSSSNLSRHKRLYCSKNFPKSCPVSDCSESYVGPKGLKKHLKSGHNIDPEISVKLSMKDRQAADLLVNPPCPAPVTPPLVGRIKNETDWPAAEPAVENLVDTAEAGGGGLVHVKAEVSAGDAVQDQDVPDSTTGGEEDVDMSRFDDVGLGGQGHDDNDGPGGQGHDDHDCHDGVDNYVNDKELKPDKCEDVRKEET